MATNEQEQQPVTAGVREDSPPVELAAEAMASSPSLSDDLEWMTQSQFAQVVFHDIADSYPNDCALLCKFTLTDLVDASPGDRVGIYRMPHFAAHEYITFEWVMGKAVGEEQQQQPQDKKDMQVEFKGDSLPKEEDYYQYQYLRGDNSVIGASIPFQLRSPKSEELCAVEDEEEFMVVRSNSAHVSEQYKDRVSEMERKYTNLLSLTEHLNEQLEYKSQSFIMLDEQCKSLQVQKNGSEHLKRDLEFVLLEKIELEKLHHKALNDLEKMTNKMEAAITEQDFLRNKVHRAEQEKVKYEEESKKQAKRVEDLNSMLTALAKSKELAVDEIKEQILKRDKSAKEAMELKQALEREKTNARRMAENLQIQIEKQKKQITIAFAEAEAAEKQGEEVERIKKLLVETEKKLERASNAKIEHKLQNQTLKFAISELTDKIAMLEAQLRERERLVGSADISQELTTPVASLVDTSGTFENMDYHSLYEDGQSRIVKLEAMLKDLQVNLKTSELTHASEIKTLRDDLEQLRTRSYVPSETSSTRNLDSIVIQAAIETAAAVEQNRYNDNIDNLGARMRNCQLCPARPFPDTLQDYLSHLVHHYYTQVMERYLNVTKFDCLDCLFVGEDLQDLVHHRGANHEEVTDFITSDAVKTELKKLGWQEKGHDFPVGQQANRNLDSLIIQNAAEFANRTVVDSAEASFHPLDSFGQPSFIRSVNSSFGGSSAGSIGSPFRAPSPQIPCSPPTQARSPAIRTNNGATYSFLPQFPGSVLTQMPQPQNEPSTLVVLQQHQNETSQSNEFSELAAWAGSGNVSSVSSSLSTEAGRSLGSNPRERRTSSSFALTDDGRPIEVDGPETSEDPTFGFLQEVEEGARGGMQELNCPLCNFTFQHGQVRELEFHVDSHLATSNNCPVCQETFSLTDIQAFERHVQEHFSVDEFSIVGSEEVTTMGARGGPLLQPSAPQRNPFETVGNVASSVASSLTTSIRSWALDID